MRRIRAPSIGLEAPQHPLCPALLPELREEGGGEGGGGRKEKKEEKERQCSFQNKNPTAGGFGKI